MILCRLRARAGVYVSGVLLLLGWTLAASATQPVTRPEMESFVYLTLAGGGAAMFAAIWVLLNSQTSRMAKSIDRLEETAAKLYDSLKVHNNDPHAHPEGSAARIDPINERLDSLNEKVSATHDVVVRLQAEHEAIRATESEVCAFVRRTADDPRRRAGDPDGIETAKLRGQQ